MKKICILLIMSILFLSACGQEATNSDISSQVTSTDNFFSETSSINTNSSSQEVSKENKNESKTDKQQSEDNKEQSSNILSSSPSIKEVVISPNETSSNDQNVQTSKQVLKELLEKGEELSRADEVYKEQLEENIRILAMSSKKNKAELLTESYPEEQIFEKYPIDRLYQSTYGYIPQMGMCDDFFGLKIECVRQLDEYSYYCVFKTKENGYLYSFFREQYAGLDIYNSIYVKETLTKADFENLKIGDSIDKVTKIDSAFLARHNYDKKRGWITGRSLHLLKDGLLSITYENDVIKSMEFNKDFLYADYHTDDKGNKFCVGIYEYKISAKDYP